MGVLSAFSKPADRRLLVLFRAPVRALAPLVPAPWRPVERRGLGLLELVYAHQPGFGVGPLPFGGDSSLLAWRVPVVHADGDARGQWVVRRLRSSRFGSMLGAASTQRAQFRYAGDEAGVELDVTAPDGGALVLRAVPRPTFRRSTFAGLREAEEAVAAFGPILNPSPLASTLGVRDVAPWRGLQPLEVLRLEARGPLGLALDGGVEPELDSAFLVVRRRLQAAPLRLPRLADLGGDPAPSLQTPLVGPATIGG